MTPEVRKRLVTKWKRFSKAYERMYSKTDDAVSSTTVQWAIEDAPDFIALIRTRASYLSALVAEGLLPPLLDEPEDDALWEVHPVNIESDPRSLYDR